MLRAARDLSLLGFAAGIRSNGLAETPAHEACLDGAQHTLWCPALAPLPCLGGTEGAWL